jgi:hypothetical protein
MAAKRGLYTQHSVGSLDGRLLLDARRGRQRRPEQHTQRFVPALLDRGRFSMAHEDFCHQVYCRLRVHTIENIGAKCNAF